MLRRRNVISWSFLVLFCRVERKFLYKRMEKGMKNKKREEGREPGFRFVGSRDFDGW